MRENFISVPFKSESGIKEFNGIAKFSAAGIVIEIESKLAGLIRLEVKEIRIGLDEILDIKFRKGIFRFFSSIQLRFKNLLKLSELPNEGGKVKLKIKRQDFERAQTAVEQTLQFMNGVEAKPLLESGEPEQGSPPVQTSVNELFDTEKLKTEDKLKTDKLDGETK